MECDIRYTGRVTSRNQVIIPKNICEAYRIEGGENVSVSIKPNHKRHKDIRLVARVHLHDPYITIPKRLANWMEIEYQDPIHVHITRINRTPTIPKYTFPTTASYESR
jgi:hypothetical protein